ncbi:MAG: ceramidase domain-containing protein [Chitinophagales bacterium]|nr:ceramidase domain-containing protein [Chitinophagales bacterium]
MKIRRFSLKYLVYLRIIIWQFYKDKIYYALGASVLFGIIIFLINHFFYPSNFWFNFTTDNNIDVWFCEKTDMLKFVRQPINTFTNFGYMVNAIFFLSKGFSDARKARSFNLITANPFYSIVLGLTSIYTFLCSTFFHSSLIELASNLDFSAVYSISLFPMMYFSHRFILLKRKKESKIKHPFETRVLVIVFSLIYLLLTFAVPLNHVHEIVACLILLTGILGYLLEKKDPNKTNKAYLIFMVIFISVAMLFFKLDIAKIGCNPDSFIQPHSIWHVCNSLAVFYFYLYIRSENYEANKDEKLLPFREEFLH